MILGELIICIYFNIINRVRVTVLEIEIFVDVNMRLFGWCGE